MSSRRRSREPHLLPNNANSHERAMSLAARFGTDIIPEDIKTLWRPGVVPVRFLAFLGWGLHVDFWHDGLSEVAKRAIIAGSFKWHRYKGTFWAIREGLRMIGVEADVKAWYELGWDEPYTFAVRAWIGDATDALMDDEVSRLVRAVIDCTKAGRDWLRALELGTKFEEDPIYEDTGNLWEHLTIESALALSDVYRLPGRVVGVGYAGSRAVVGVGNCGAGRVGDYPGSLRAGNGVEELDAIGAIVHGLDDVVRGALPRVRYDPVGIGHVGAVGAVAESGGQMTMSRTPRVGAHRRAGGCIKCGVPRAGVGFAVGQGGERIGSEYITAWI